MNKVTYEERKAIYETALREWGIYAQINMAIEEMSELTKELCKVLREKGNFDNVADEIADVTIMMEQLRIFFDINDEVCDHMDMKVRRLADRLGVKAEKDAAEQRKKAMLSQPMAGKTDEEIAAAREKTIAALEARGYQVVNTLFTDEWYSKESMESRGVERIPLCFLAKSLENMSLCDAAYFCKGWESTRGCKIEHDAAVAYGLDIIYEE